MEGEINSEAPLDYAIFQISSAQNRYEAYICCEGGIERLASGELEQLQLHLLAVKFLRSNGSSENFKLELPENLRGSSWFTKSTLSRFLRMVNTPELFKDVDAILHEMSQLEEAKRFHLSLYAQVPQNHSADAITDTNCFKDMRLVQEASSDATKNELLRAMNLRLTASRQELTTAVNQAVGGACTTAQMIDLAEFSQHFGSIELRNFLSKYLALGPIHSSDPLNEHLASSHQTSDHTANLTDQKDRAGSPIVTDKACKVFASPAKLAQAERQSPPESEKSSNSSEDDGPCVERSRPLIRSASPRRSASPMRRVQIGRSGSRRSTALTIKSLSYFPAREKLLANRDANGNNSEDEEMDQLAKKAENTVRRMSVQDAINLFESKQRDQKSDLQKLRSSGEVCVSGTNKSVLRRWSAGMGDPTQCEPDISSECGVHGTDTNLEPAQNGKLEEEVVRSDPVESAEVVEMPAVEEGASLSANQIESAVTKPEDIHDWVADSTEWTRQKEAELNQMLMKMMDSKPTRFRTVTTNESEKHEISAERKGSFYDQYREKRNEKLRGDNTVKRTQEAQLKAMHEMLNKRKEEMTLKNGVVPEKQDSPAPSQKPRRNSSPSAGPKREPFPKPVSLRKVPPKASSSLPATRSSWPSAPSPRPSLPSPSKASGVVSSPRPTINRRKPQTNPSVTQPTLKTEKSKPLEKTSNPTQPEKKQSLKGQEQRQQHLATKNSKTTKPKTIKASGDDSGGGPAKPSFYSKVTKKSSVVPLETKPFLRKGTGLGTRVGAAAVKTKASQSDESSKDSGNLVQVEEKLEVVSGPVEAIITEVPKENLALLESNVLNIESPRSSEELCLNPEISSQFAAESVDSFAKPEESPLEIQPTEDSGISSSAWVEVVPLVLPQPCEDSPTLSLNANPGKVDQAISSPRIRYSLSHMLQAESGEPDVIEWGNAENPPAMVYQKESPKGLKRLLKFARKSRGEANSTGWASPSVFSEGEDDAEELKGASKRNADGLARKAALQTKGSGQQKTMFSENYVGGNVRRATDMAAHELPSAQSSMNKFSAYSSDKLREGQTTAVAASTKGTRSFFSLSTFRSSKSSETKFR